MDIHISYSLVLALAAIYALYYFIAKALKEKGDKASNEAEFLEQLVKSHNYWTEKGEKEYAAAFKVLINKFTQNDEE